MKMLRVTSLEWRASFLIGSVFYFLFSPLAIPQGSLTPPGPPGPTMKTLDQLEARTPIDAIHTPGDSTNEFIINQAGSYYLTGNLNIAKNGIRVIAAGVTIDLNGFQITRSSGNGSGIVVAPAASNCTIRNGSIAGLSGNGIDAPVPARGGAVSYVTISSCAIGLLAGESWRIDHCSALGNGNDGIQTDVGATISASLSSNNGGNGFTLGAGSTIVDCSASGNQGSAGIGAGRGSVIAHCAANGNTGSGSSSAGISCFTACTITACTADSNTSTYATPSGLTGAGIVAPFDSTVQNCTVSSNKGDGIQVLSSGVILTNVCTSNGLNGNGAGIHAFINGSRIEGNQVRGNDRGIYAESGGNFIIKNSAKNNGPTNNLNYDLVAGNRYGPIIDLTATGTAAVTGNSAADTTATTHPWANFAY